MGGTLTTIGKTPGKVGRFYPTPPMCRAKKDLAGNGPERVLTFPSFIYIFYLYYSTML
jgi:hypothetical protein